MTSPLHLCVDKNQECRPGVPSVALPTIQCQPLSLCSTKLRLIRQRGMICCRLMMPSCRINRNARDAKCCASGFEKPNPEASDGRRFLALKTTQDYPWGAVGEIFNAGLLLLQPDYCLSTWLLSQVTCKSHPCYVAGKVT